MNTVHFARDCGRSDGTTAFGVGFATGFHFGFTGDGGPAAGAAGSVTGVLAPTSPPAPP